jgi:hypothetical protein
MTIAFVLGNGISRQDIPVTILQQCGKIYGCNGLHRECTPEALIATDRPIATHIQQSGYAKTNRFYTRRPLPELGALQVPAEYYGYSSGPIALSIAARDGHRRVYLLGFDLGPTAENQFNNIYAGTQFYKPNGAGPTFTGNWIKQMCRVIADHPRTRFYRVFGNTSASVAELDVLPNLINLDLPSFQDRINNQKDL